MTQRFAEGKPLELGFEGQGVPVTQECQLEGIGDAHKRQERGEHVGGKVDTLVAAKRVGSWGGRPCRRGPVLVSRPGLILKEGWGGVAGPGAGRGQLEGHSAT